MTINRAILSVSDKRGLADFAQALSAVGIEILSTGGTASLLAEAGVPVVAVSEYTGAPEILGGRVKTLHPRIHGGILARNTQEHREELEAQGMEAIDLVVVNLYPFEATIARDGVSQEEAIENIDIGGPCMVRAAAKNHERVAVVVDPSDYEELAALIAEGEIPLERRAELAAKAFAHTAAYDAAIANYLAAKEQGFAETMSHQWERHTVLRYGENPHQSAALYRTGAGKGNSIADGVLLGGKALSYNNLLDLDAAYRCCLEFDAPCAVVVKHTNPCGVATGSQLAQAYQRARQTDPTSSFGGIVAVNRPVDVELAELLAGTFLECVVAPAFDDDARERLAAKKNLRLLACTPSDAPWAAPVLRSISGGVLVQSEDQEMIDVAEATVVTERRPSSEELAALQLAWRVAKHVKSNAIVFADVEGTLAIGAGQMSRIDSVKLCQLKSEFPLENSCVASDAFFPFRDGVDALADAGATAVIQPGGSIRDAEVIDAANERGLAMVVTGRRHFRH